MQTPLISVITPFHNGQKFLKECIQSILDQSFGDFEFLLIDDASSDTSQEIVKSFDDPRIHYFHFPKQQHKVKTLNFGIKKARGTYIAIMDWDDISLPERFEKQVDFLNKHSDIVIVGSQIELIDQDGKHLGNLKKPLTPHQIKKDLLFYNTFVQPSVMMRKEIVEKIGGYQTNFGTHFAQDWDLWMRIVYEGYLCANLATSLLKYRFHTTSTSHTHSRIMALKTFRMRKYYIHKFGLKISFFTRLFLYIQLGIGIIFPGKLKLIIEKLYKKLFIRYG